MPQQAVCITEISKRFTTCCPRSWLLARSHLKVHLKFRLHLALKHLPFQPVLTKVNIQCSILKRFHFYKQTSLPEGQQDTVPNPLPHLCSRSGMSLFMRAVVTCCSISNTSSHPVRIWVARAKILTFSS